MLSLGLSSADQKKFEASLFTPPGYNLKITVQILDLNHRYISDVSAQLVDGQVNYTYTDILSSSSSAVPVTASAANMTLLDPDHLTSFDTSSPSDNALYADRMIRIVYSVFSELLPRWVDVPIFCGPVTKVKRDDAILSVECLGKESLVSEPTLAWAAKTYKKTDKGVTAIRDLMTTRAGETKFDLPGFTYTLGRDFVMAGETIIWDLAREMAGSTRQLFYDGRGVLRLRETSTSPIYTIVEDHLTSVPQLDYNHGDIRNGVRVVGSINTLRAYRYLTDASSPINLGRNGVKRHIMELVNDTTLTTQSAVDAAAQKLIDGFKVRELGYDFDCFVIPHLEPGDIFRVATPTTSIVLRYRAGSIPLRAGTQSMGTIKKVVIQPSEVASDVSKFYGSVIDVSTTNIGENITAAAAIGATVIPVADPTTFNELGGQVKINGSPYLYTGIDAAASTILLDPTTPLEVAVVEDDRVEIDPPAPARQALIDLGVPEGEAIRVTIPHALATVLEDGMREEGNRELALLEERNIGEVFLADIATAPATLASQGYLESSAGWALGNQGVQIDNANVLYELGADTISARAISLDGQDLATEFLNTLPRGIFAYDTKASGTDTASVTTTETKLFEFSAGSMEVGRLYKTVINGFLNGTVAGDVFVLRVRYTLDGSTPGVANTSQRSFDVEMSSNTNAIFDYQKVFTILTPTDNYRACLTLVRGSGSGSCNIGFSRPLEWYVEDMGLYGAATEAGTLSQKSYADATPPDADPVKTYTKTWSATWTRSYDGDLGTRSPDDDDCYQGYFSSTHGRTRSLIGFDYASIQSALSGATVKSVKFTYRVKHAWSNAGAELHISSHTYTSKPSTWGGGSVAENLVITGGKKEGSTYTTSLGTSIGNEFKNGTKRGLGFGPGSHSMETDYAYVYGGDSSSSRPRITIEYTK